MKKITFIICLFILLAHFTLLFFYNMPKSSVSFRMIPIAEKYIKPIFIQNWSLFAPSPKIKINLFLVGKDTTLVNKPSRKKESFVYNTLLFYQTLNPPKNETDIGQFRKNRDKFMRDVLSYAIRKDFSNTQIDNKKLIIVSEYYFSPEKINKVEKTEYEITR